MFFSVVATMTGSSPRLLGPMKYLSKRVWWYIFDKLVRHSNGVFFRSFMLWEALNLIFYFRTINGLCLQPSEDRYKMYCIQLQVASFENNFLEEPSFLLSSFGIVVHMLKLVYHLQYWVLCHCCTWCIQSGLNRVCATNTKTML